MILIGESKKKIFTIPEGEYNGYWYNSTCCIVEFSGVVLYSFDTKIKTKIRRKNVVIKIEGTKAKIYQL